MCLKSKVTWYFKALVRFRCMPVSIRHGSWKQKHVRVGLDRCTPEHLQLPAAFARLLQRLWVYNSLKASLGLRMRKRVNKEERTLSVANTTKA